MPVVDVKFIQQNGRISLHPDCEPTLVALPPWRRHALHHRIAGAVYAHQGGSAAEGDPELAENGITIIRKMLSKKDAGLLSRRAGRVIDATGGHLDATDDPDNAAQVVECDVDLRRMVVEMLPTILNEKHTATFERYFGCHFRIDNLRLYRTYPSKKSTISFRWHRDVAPMAQVHVMLYLTDSGDKAGSTSFLDIEQTKLAARAGYHYPNIAKRTGDIEEVFADTRHKPKVNRPQVRAGDAIAFAAPRVLHCGNLPLTGFRDVLLLVLLPSFMPWQRDVEDINPDYLFITDSKSTLLTNPYKLCNPTIASEVIYGRSPDLEPWVCEGDLFPHDL